MHVYETTSGFEWMRCGYAKVFNSFIYLRYSFTSIRSICSISQSSTKVGVCRAGFGALFVTVVEAVALKPGFHYPSWWPELTARVDGWPVSITRQHGPCWRNRALLPFSITFRCLSMLFCDLNAFCCILNITVFLIRRTTTVPTYVWCIFCDSINRPDDLWPLTSWPLNRFMGYSYDSLPFCQFWVSFAFPFSS